MIEGYLSVPTPDGAMQTFYCHPERQGPHPTVVFLMDAPGIREELRDMVRRLAAVGYYVALPNLYYRSGVMELGPIPRRAEGPMIPIILSHMNSLTVAMVMADVEALTVSLDAEAQAREGPAAAIGYCMSGRFAVNAAARWPQRFGMVASIHGTSLVTDEPESPHRVAPSLAARVYFACAEHDEEAPLETVHQLEAALASGTADAEVEIYRGAEHGFAFPGRDAYSRPAAERHWERLFEFLRSLG
jgi:carboxymethylenebutenolidase